MRRLRSRDWSGLWRSGMQPRQVSRATAEHYTWGDQCDGWHLVKDERLQHVAPQSIRARLKDRPQACSGIVCPQCGEGTRNCCRVMRKVVDDRNTIHLGADFEATFHALEGFQRG